MRLMKWRREQKQSYLTWKNIILHHDLSVGTQICFCIYWYRKHSDKKSNNHQSTEDKGLKSPRAELLLSKDLVFTCWLKVHGCDNQSIKNQSMIKWQPVMRQNTPRRTKLASLALKTFHHGSFGKILNFSVAELFDDSHWSSYKRMN